MFDDAPPPPELSRTLDYRAWGVNLLDLPAGEVRTMNAVYNAYNAISQYKQATAQHRSADWAKANPAAWNVVSDILARHKGIKDW